MYVSLKQGYGSVIFCSSVGQIYLVSGNLRVYLRGLKSAVHMCDLIITFNGL